MMIRIIDQNQAVDKLLKDENIRKTLYLFSKLIEMEEYANPFVLYWFIILLDKLFHLQNSSASIK